MTWHPIIAYRVFYDLPRMFIIQPSPGLLLLFDSPFVESEDEYSPLFIVSVLRNSAVTDLPLDWSSIPSSIRIGLIAVTAVEFDATRRREVAVEGLDDLISAAAKLQ